MSDGVADREFHNRPSPDSRIIGPWRLLQSHPGAGGSMRNPVRRRKPLDVRIQGKGNFVKTPGVDSVGAVFVFMDLFETDADFVA